MSSNFSLNFPGQIDENININSGENNITLNPEFVKLEEKNISDMGSIDCSCSMNLSSINKSTLGKINMDTIKDIDIEKIIEEENKIQMNDDELINYLIGSGNVDSDDQPYEDEGEESLIEMQQIQNYLTRKQEQLETIQEQINEVKKTARKTNTTNTNKIINAKGNNLKENETQKDKINKGSFISKNKKSYMEITKSKNDFTKKKESQTININNKGNNKKTGNNSPLRKNKNDYKTVIQKTVPSETASCNTDKGMKNIRTFENFIAAQKEHIKKVQEKIQEIKEEKQKKLNKIFRDVPEINVKSQKLVNDKPVYERLYKKKDLIIATVSEVTDLRMLALKKITKQKQKYLNNLYKDGQKHKEKVKELQTEIDNKLHTKKSEGLGTSNRIIFNKFKSQFQKAVSNIKGYISDEMISYKQCIDLLIEMGFINESTGINKSDKKTNNKGFLNISQKEQQLLISLLNSVSFDSNFEIASYNRDNSILEIHLDHLFIFCLSIIGLLNYYILQSDLKANGNKTNGNSSNLPTNGSNFPQQTTKTENITSIRNENNPQKEDIQKRINEINNSLYKKITVFKKYGGYDSNKNYIITPSQAKTIFNDFRMFHFNWKNKGKEIQSLRNSEIINGNIKQTMWTKNTNNDNDGNINYRTQYDTNTFKSARMVKAKSQGKISIRKEASNKGNKNHTMTVQNSSKSLKYNRVRPKTSNKNNICQTMHNKSTTNIDSVKPSSPGNNLEEAINGENKSNDYEEEKSKTQKITKKGNLFSHINQSNLRKKELEMELLKVKEYQTKKELEECTFKPKINKTKLYKGEIFPKNDKTAECLTEILYQKGKAMQKYREDKNQDDLEYEREKNECTFQPRLNTHNNRNKSKDHLYAMQTKLEEKVTERYRKSRMEREMKQNIKELRNSITNSKDYRASRSLSKTYRNQKLKFCDEKLLNEIDQNINYKNYYNEQTHNYQMTEISNVPSFNGRSKIYFIIL